MNFTRTIYNSIDGENIINLYYKGLGTPLLGRMYQTSCKNIQRFLKVNNVVLRGIGEHTDFGKKLLAIAQTGKTYSTESKLKMSHNRLGKHLTEATKQKLSNLSLGVPKSKEAIANYIKARTGVPWTSKQREALEGKSKSEEHKRKLSETLMGRPSCMKGKSHTEESKINMSNGLKKYFAIPENLEKNRIARINLYKTEYGEVLKEKQKQIMENLWQTPEFVSKQMRARGVAPNKLETFFEDVLHKLYPNEWKFVGDGQLIIAGKCPDFVNVNGKKLLIELYGDYWHKGQNIQDRISLFKEYGWDTLIIWENELKNSLESVKNKLQNFIGGHNS